MLFFVYMGSDFHPVNMTLNFTSDRQEIEVAIPIVDDEVYEEHPETFTPKIDILGSNVNATVDPLTLNVVHVIIQGVLLAKLNNVLATNTAQIILVVSVSLSLSLSHLSTSQNIREINLGFTIGDLSEIFIMMPMLNLLLHTLNNKEYL